MRWLNFDILENDCRANLYRFWNCPNSKRSDIGDQLFNFLMQNQSYISLGRLALKKIDPLFP